MRPPSTQGSIEQCSSVVGGYKPGQNPEEGVRGKFCAGRSAQALGKISTSAAIRRRLVLSVSGKTLLAKRNRAILGLLLSNNLRIDNLVNLSVSDYFSVGSLQLLNVSGVVKQTTPIRASVKRLIDDYLVSFGYQGMGKLPLLQSLDKKTGKTLGVALCTKDIASVVRTQARRLKVSGKVQIKS